LISTAPRSSRRHRGGQGPLPLEGLSQWQPTEDHTLAADEFIRRFLLHVLPEGFQRIRYYGFLANRYREQKLARCRQLLAMSQPEPPDHQAERDYHDQYQELTGTSLTDCPACRRGRMVIIEVLKPVKPRRPIDDTS
jgi:hypothetical protein